MANLPKHKLARVATGTAVTSVPATVYAIQVVGGSAATTGKLFNNADGSGTEVYGAAAIIGDTVFIDLERLGPIYFSSKLYVTPAGTGGVVYVWYD